MRGGVFNGWEIAPAARDGGDVAVLSTLLHCFAQVAAHPCTAERDWSGKNVMTQLEVKKSLNGRRIHVTACRSTMMQWGQMLKA